MVAVLRAELDRPGRQLDPEVDLTHRLRDHAPRQCLITVRVALLVTFDQPLTAVQPRRGDGELTPDAVVPKDVEGEERSACPVPGVNLRLERTLLRLEREVGLRAEPRRLGQRFQVVGPEGALAVGLRQEVERLLPAVRLERSPRLLRDGAHAQHRHEHDQQEPGDREHRLHQRLATGGELGDVEQRQYEVEQCADDVGDRRAPQHR